ncbi:putative lipase/esterase from carbohydrate esterase family CE10 [Reticulomyxa filosa]|uniref:Putative lipase/esterase from carbohydrate esterase family CE10 n=1 Tax=Reticulomyxa filosa TaxID=46433 RepID=X6NT00_RETFI|nr:putative lipase/esterase from carbohydrate esterase family CE10 [Reticulomyxa filosa]|eukprot:ETO29146.1 putative lipase/esterase from carbohydrate esterase family CE10 [Reticulomyxa filosa]
MSHVANSFLTDATNEEWNTISPELRAFKDYSNFMWSFFTDEWLERASDEDFLWYFKRYFNFQGCLVPPSTSCRIERSVINTSQIGLNAQTIELLPGSVNIIKISDGNLNQEKTQKKVVLFVHGGGYVFGGASHAGYLCHVSKALNGTDILLVDYTKAPQKQLPFQAYEVLTAYLYALFHWNIPSENIVIMGDSAGGGLALLFVQLLSEWKDKTMVISPPKGLVITSPWLDLSVSGPTWQTQRKNDILIKELFAKRCARMVTNTSDPKSQKNSAFSPLFGTLEKLPTHIYILVSTNECLHSEIRTLINKLQSVGKDWRFQEHFDVHKSKNTTNELWVVEKKFMPHTWVNFVGVFPEAQIALDELAHVVNAWFSNPH